MRSFENIKEYHYHTTDFDFSKAKNALLEKVIIDDNLTDSDVIIYLDIDEEIVGNYKYLNETLELMSRNEEIGGAICRIASFNDYSPNFDEPKIDITKGIKIFRAKYRFTGRIHEQLINAIVSDNKTLIPTRVLLFHYGYDDGQINVEKVFRNLQLLCRNISEGYDDNLEGQSKMSTDLSYLSKSIDDLKKAGVL